MKPLKLNRPLLEVNWSSVPPGEPAGTPTTPPALEAIFTVCALLTGLPLASSTATAIVPTDDPLAISWPGVLGVVITTWVAAPGVSEMGAEFAMTVDSRAESVKSNT